MNMKKLIVPLAALVCLLLAACDKDEIVRPPMEWTYEILTPGSVGYEGGSVGWAPQYNFRANGLEGDIVMTCTNYDVLNLTQGDSYTYDCGWATVKVEGNRLRIHFPYDCSGGGDRGIGNDQRIGQQRVAKGGEHRLPYPYIRQ